MSLTTRERQVLEKLLVIGDLKLAATELGVKPSTIYVMRARVRGKIEQARDLLKEVKRYKKVLGSSQRW